MCEGLRIDSDRSGVSVQRGAEQLRALLYESGSRRGDLQVPHMSRAARGDVVDQPRCEQRADDAARCGFGDAQRIGQEAAGDARMLGDDDEGDVAVVAQAVRRQ